MIALTADNFSIPDVCNLEGSVELKRPITQVAVAFVRDGHVGGKATAPIIGYGEINSIHLESLGTRHEE